MKACRFAPILAAVGVCAAAGALAQETRLNLTSLSPAGSPNSQFFNAWAKRVKIGRAHV